MPPARPANLWKQLSDSLFNVPHKTGRVGYAIIFLTATFSVAVLAALNYKDTYDTLTRIEYQRKLESSRLMAALVHEKLDSWLGLGVSLALRPLVIDKINAGEWAAAMGLLEGVPQAFIFIDRIFLTDPQGTVMADWPAMRGAVGASRADQDWYLGVSRHWQPYICEVFKRKSEPRINVIDVAIPVKVDPANTSKPVSSFSDKGRVLAILVLQVKLENFAQLVTQGHLNLGEVVYIVDHKGRLVYHPKFPPQGEIVDFSAVPSVRRILQGYEGVESVTNEIERTTRLSAFTGVKEYGWGVVIAQPVDLAFAERDHKMAGFLFIYGLFFMASAVFIFVVLKLLSKNERIAEEMSELYNQAPCGYHSLDKDGKYVRINDTELNWLGYKREEVVGVLSFRDVIVSTYLKKFEDEYPRFKERGWVKGLEFEMRRKDGTTFPAYLNAVAIKDSRGNFLRTRSVIFDTSEHDKLAREARESQERFRLWSEISPVGILVIQDSKVKYVNPAVTKMLGYSVTDHDAMGSMKWLCDDGGKALECIQNILVGAEKLAKYEVRLLRKDDRVLWCECLMVRIDHGGRPAVWTSLLDITESKTLEEELKLKNILLTCQAEASIDGLLAVDAQGKIISFNKRFADMWHIPPEILQSKEDEPVLRWVTGCVRDSDSFLKKVQYLYEHHSETSRDELGLRDGRVFDRYSSPMFGDDGRYFGRVWYFRDITANYLFEQRLKRAAYEWRRTFDSIVDFMFLLDKESRIVQANMAFCNALKVRPQDLVGKKCTEIDGQGYFLPRWALQDILKDGKPYTEAVKGRNGIPFMMSISPVFDEKQVMIGAVFVARDISVQKQAEQKLLQAYEELKQTKDKLVQSEKMASIGQLAAGVAHEINNPVGFVSSNLEVMTGYIYAYMQVIKLIEQAQEAMNRKAFEEVKSIIAEIEEFEKSVNLKFMVNDSELLLQQSQEGMARIAKIVADLKNMAREDTQWLEEPSRVEEILEQSLSIVHNEFKYRIELRKFYGDTSAVPCNAGKIGQVFLNLLVNAIQAIPDKGVIEIKTYQEAGYVCVEIKDNGCGISPENAKRVFDPFFTTKPAGQGTGLGLSISYDIIQKHRGEITVESQVGQGTTFIVKLPLPLPKPVQAG